MEWTFDTEFAHAHIYYVPETRAVAERFRAKVIAEFGSSVQVSRLIDRLIGPHPEPMFEVDFRADLLPKIGPFLDREREGLDILIHRVSEDEVNDHTVRAKWLGTPRKLDIAFLEEFMAGKVASVRTNLHSK
jgi:DOPA 4,5-dioxygenase